MKTGATMVIAWLTAGISLPALAREAQSPGDPKAECQTATEVISFRRASAKLDRPARKALDRVVEWMKMDDDRQAEVEGYASPAGEAANTERLSDTRARAVENYLRQRGIDSQRVEVFGRGDISPPTADDDAASSRVAVVSTCEPAPAPAVAAEQQPPASPAPEALPAETPPPPPAETPAEPVAPPPTAPVESSTMPAEAGVSAQQYEPRPLSGVGVALSAGGGISGFFAGGARDFASDGFGWDVRLTLGTRTPVGLDLAYVGSAQDLRLTGLDSDALLLGNGGEAAVRIQLPTGMLRPYISGGVGWTHYSVESTGLVNGLLGGDTIGTVPIALGLAIGNVNGLTFDVRAASRIAFDDDMLDGVSDNSSLNSWGFTARLGAEF